MVCHEKIEGVWFELALKGVCLPLRRKKGQHYGLELVMLVLAMHSSPHCRE